MSHDSFLWSVLAINKTLHSLLFEESMGSEMEYRCEATSLEDIIQEMLLTRSSERQGRVIDRDQSASMEKKKQEGYF